MFYIDKIRNRITLLIFSLLVIAFIGYLDFITGSELSFSVFYLIPLAFLALYRNSSLFIVILSSVFASVIWFFAEFSGRDFSIMFIPVWNTIMRLFIFLLVGFLLYTFKEEHKKLIKAYGKLEVINKEKNNFIGIAAHDLRSPLAGIYSFTELMLNDPKKKLSPEVSEIILLIRKMSNNGMTMIKDLLDISKIESGNVELRVQHNDYISFLKEQIRINQLLAQNKEITIILDSQTDNIFACFDSNYLTEVIDNLLTNAIKFSYRKSFVTVKVSIIDGNMVLTEVVDTGKGIQVNEQQYLFNYFQKTSTRPTAGEQSTGLGLAIAKKIVISHKGTIGVTSKIDEGSNFYFTLPLMC